VDRGRASPFFTKEDFPLLEDKELNPTDISPDGRFLVGHSDRYRRGFQGSNGFFRAHHAAVLLDFDNPEQIFLVGKGCQPTFSPVDDWIYHVCGGGKECPLKSDIMRLQVSDRQKRTRYEAVVVRPDMIWGHTYQPRVSNNGEWLAYAATTDGCHDQDTCDYEVFLQRLRVLSLPIRLTREPGNDQWPHLWVGAMWPPTLSRD